jgi:hypothetical protein
VRCWHRLRMRGRLHTCINCGVLIEECPCVNYRVSDPACPGCSGSGWVSVVRGHIAKFQEYLDARC